MPEIERPPGSPAQVAPAEVPGLAGLLTLAVGVVVISALYVARDVLVPIMLAVLLSFVLAPLVGLLRRIHIPNVPAVIVTVLLALGIFGFVAAVLGSQVASLATNAPQYAATVETKVAKFRQSTVGELPKLIGRLGRQFDRASGVEPAPVRRGVAVGTVQRPMQVEMRSAAVTPVGLIKSILGPVVKPLETTLIVLVVAIFILLQREDLRDRLIRLFGSNDLHRTTTAMDDAASRLGRYFLTQLALNAAFGGIIATGLYFIGVPSPILWGILAALLRFLPYIGAFLSALPPLVLAMAVGSDWSMAISTAFLFLAAEPVMGYVIEPMVYGHSTGLSPAAVIIAAVFWTWLWGPVGLVLSTPLTLCLVVLGRHFDRLEFLDVLLGDRPALSPVESFYQRMLAGDVDEVLDQAEQLLGERSLSSYYDEIAIKALQLAAIDADRGVLTPVRLQRVRDTSAELINDLSSHADETPAPSRREASLTLAERAVPVQSPPGEAVGLPPEAWRREGAVLCIAARGALDSSAAAMLGQILGKHGLGSRVIHHDAVSRERLAELDTAAAMLVVVCGLQFAGAPPHLRFLLRRLRARLPGIPMLVAVWSDGENSDAEREAVGADHYTATIRGAVVISLDVALGNDVEVKTMVQAAFG